MGHGHGGSRKSAGGDGVGEDAEGAGETRLLIGVGGEECGQKCLEVTCPVIAKSEGWVKESGRSRDGTFGCQVSLSRETELCRVGISEI